MQSFECTQNRRNREAQRLLESLNQPEGHQTASVIQSVHVSHQTEAIRVC